LKSHLENELPSLTPKNQSPSKLFTVSLRFDYEKSILYQNHDFRMHILHPPFIIIPPFPNIIKSAMLFQKTPPTQEAKKEIYSLFPP